MSPDALAQANAALERGDLTGAVDLFERAAATQLEAGDPASASHGHRLAAVLALTVGDPSRAAPLAARAVEEAGDRRARFAALTTLAEAHRHAGQAGEACRSITAALDLASADGAVVTPVERAALLRRRAAVEHAAGRDGDAVADLRCAAELLAAAGEDAQAAVTQLELAGVAGGAPAVREALVTARRRAGSAGGAAGVAALAQVDAAEGGHALEEGRVDAARELFRSACEHALAAVDAATYIAASGGLAAAEERAGDRVAAYEALASGWVTLADLLGPELGAEAFRPQLERVRARWGATEFARVKAAHDESRRAALRSDTAG